MDKLFSLTLLICWFVMRADGARILGIFPSHGRSHYSLGESLMKALANAGHQVTMVSPYKQPTIVPNYTDVHLDGTRWVVEKNRNILNKAYKTNILRSIIEIYTISIEECDVKFNHKAFKALRESNKQFDLIIIDIFASHFQTGLCHQYKAACIVVSSFGANRAMQRFTGDHLPLSYVPSMFLPFSDHMTFFERLWNTLHSLAIDIIEEYYAMVLERDLYQKYFPDAPDLAIMQRNVSLVFANSWIGMETPRPILPIVKQIGGIHVKEPQKLPEDLQEILDNATEGVIYFSLGSNLMSKELPNHILESFIKVFSKLKQKVLWKYEADAMLNKPENVITRKWLPQSDILAHSNIKAFISHGGVMGLTEAVIRGVPIIGIPFFADQFSNVAAMVSFGYGLSIQVKHINENSLAYAIDEIINNTKYFEAVKRGSLLMKDRPLKANESAIYWVEHVLRHKGGNHLRSRNVDLPSYQYWLLDVWAFILFVFLTIFFFIYYIIRYCLCKFIVKKTKVE